jgi:hypothetical protein
MPAFRIMLTSSPLKLRVVVVLSLALVAIYATYLLRSDSGVRFSVPANPKKWPGSATGRKDSAHIQEPELPQIPSRANDAPEHPIDRLIRDAVRQHGELLQKRSFDLPTAAQRYRERRGRHPPPGFDIWFEKAKEMDALVVEEYFDRMYQDLAPLWAIDHHKLKRQANSYVQVVRVRKGKLSFETDYSRTRQPYIQLWSSVIERFAEYLPDVDMPINFMDETRLLVPWEKINEYIKIEEATRRLVPPELAISSYPGLSAVDNSRDVAYDPHWIRQGAPKYWDIYRMTCPPDSPGRNRSAIPDFSQPVKYPVDWMASAPYAYKGFVENFTLSADPCYQPHLRGMHGTFVESISMATSTELIPLFGGSKLSRNNEILIPGAMYITADPFYSGGEDHGPPWAQKELGLRWRGVASGGRNKEDNWWHFHRHRFIQMTNATTIAHPSAEEIPKYQTFDLPPASLYDMELLDDPAQLAKWWSEFADTGFVHLECYPSVMDQKNKEKLPSCQYTDPYFALVDSIPMKKQYGFKYLPDVDGNSFSGRWRGFLLSTSLPLKATIYAEWHDSRLIPWLHFVPFDNTFSDIYAIMHYFLDGRDDMAQFIAEQGKKWAESVYRQEDMLLWIWRILLEFARLCDENREYLGYVDDIVHEKQAAQ